MKKLYFLIIIFFAVQIQVNAQNWNESFENDSIVSNYTRNTGFEFRNTGTGSLVLRIGRDKGTANGNATDPSDGSFALYNMEAATGKRYEFVTSYFNIQNSNDSVRFDFKNSNNATTVKIKIALIDSVGNRTLYDSSTVGSNSLTVQKFFFNKSNFPGFGWYRVVFDFETLSGNGNGAFMMDNFRSSIGEFSPYLSDFEIGCSNVFQNQNQTNTDTLLYTTTVTNNGPDTLFASTIGTILVTFPSNGITFSQNLSDISIPIGTSIDTATGNPNTLRWLIDDILVGVTNQITFRGTYNPITNWGNFVTPTSSFTGFSAITLDPNNTNNTSLCPPIMLLPIKLSSFEATHNKIATNVTWSTVIENNNQGFEIYSSPDAKNWEYLGFVEGIGNSYDETNYMYVDNTPLTHTRFYKLVQVNQDGKTDEFGPVRINIDNKYLNKNITVFPNPSNGIVSISIVNTHTASNLAKTEVNVYSITGQAVHNVALDFSTTDIHSIDLSHLPKGQYIIKLSSNDHVHAVKVILE